MIPGGVDCVVAKKGSVARSMLVIVAERSVWSKCLHWLSCRTFAGNSFMVASSLGPLGYPNSYG